MIKRVPLDRQGRATLATGPLVALGHQIVAHYAGNAYYTASTATLIQRLH